MAQTLLGRNSKSLLIFDEIEDVFASSFFERSIAQRNKAWLNQLLENNNVPMIWISNSVSGIDEAFLRRFDFILEMPDLPSKNKADLIRNLASDKLSAEYIQHFAKEQSLTPAILDRAIKVANQVNLQKSVQNTVDHLFREKTSQSDSSLTTSWPLHVTAKQVAIGIIFVNLPWFHQPHFLQAEKIIFYFSHQQMKKYFSHPVSRVQHTENPPCVELCLMQFFAIMGFPAIQKVLSAYDDNSYLAKYRP